MYLYSWRNSRLRNPCIRGCQELNWVLWKLLWHWLPSQENGSHLSSKNVCKSNGELGMHYLCVIRPSQWCGALTSGSCGEEYENCGSWDSSHVVRQSCDNGLVEWHLAQWRVCQILRILVYGQCLSKGQFQRYVHCRCVQFCDSKRYLGRNSSHWDKCARPWETVGGVWFYFICKRKQFCKNGGRLCGKRELQEKRQGVPAKVLVEKHSDQRSLVLYLQELWEWRHPWDAQSIHEAKKLALSKL